MHCEDNLLDNDQIRPRETSQSFRFGDGEVFSCTKVVTLPLKVVSKDGVPEVLEAKVCVVKEIFLSL